MQENTYPTFNYYGQNVILLPGSKFTKKELQGRLNQMNIDYDINLDKNSLTSLYESKLKYDENKLAIFEKLRKDTQNYLAKSDYSGRQSLPANLSTSNRNINNGKVMSISCEVIEPFNIKEQSFNKTNNNNNINQSHYSHNNLRINNYNKNNDNNVLNSNINNNYISNSRQNTAYFPNKNVQSSNYNYNKNYSNSRNVLSNNSQKNNYQEEINTDIINKNNINDNIKVSNFNNSDQRQHIYSSNNNIRNSNVTEYDNESNFTFFSVFKPLKTSLYKNRKQLCHDLIYLLILAFIGLGLLYLMINNSSTIAEFLREFIRLLSSPLELISFIKNLFCTIFFGALKYFYVIIPLIVILVFGFFYYKKLIFKKQCRKILNEIIKDMRDCKRDRGVRVSETEIYRMYFENNGVSYNDFLKKYLPVLNKLRRKETQIRVSNIIENGKNVIYWELNN